MSNILRSPYDFRLDFPREETFLEHFVNGIKKLCQLGYGHVKCLLNPDTGKFYRTDEILPLSQKIASHFFRRGLTGGDTVLYSSHDLSVYIVMVGVWRANGVMRAIYPQENASTMAKKIIESKAKWFLVDPETMEEASKARVLVPWPVEIIVCDLNSNSNSNSSSGGGSILNLSLFFQDDEQELDFPEFKRGRSDPLVVFGTSGTTGPSMGCVYSQSSILKLMPNLRQLLLGYAEPILPEFSEVAPQVVLLTAQPTHVGGCCLSLCLLLTARVNNVIMNKPTKERLFRAVHYYKPDFITGFPNLLLNLAADPEAKTYDLSSLKVFAVFGDVLGEAPHFVNTIEQNLGAKVINVYAMTEGGVFASSRNLNQKCPQKNPREIKWSDLPQGSVGKLLPGVSLKVEDPVTREILGANQAGELCFKTPFMFDGYLNPADAKEQTFVDGGFLKSGDLGYYDDRGFIFVQNRLKECFRYHGNHINPADLENVLLEHPLVDSVKVVGIPIPIPIPKDGSSVPRAFVTLKENGGQNGMTIAQEIRQFANEKLSGYRRLRGGLVILPQLPLNKAGKIDTNYLKQFQFSMDSDE